MSAPQGFASEEEFLRQFDDPPQDVSDYYPDATFAPPPDAFEDDTGTGHDPIGDQLGLIIATLKNIDNRLGVLEAKFGEVFADQETERRLADARKPSSRMNVACVSCRKAKARCSHESPCERCAVRGEQCVYEVHGVNE
jgi:hypothetical protein